MYLITGVLKVHVSQTFVSYHHSYDFFQDSAVRSPLDSQNLFESSPIQSCLTALQKLVSLRYPTHPGLPLCLALIVVSEVFNISEEEKNYLLVVESGLLTVLDLAKTAPQQSKLDEISLLLAIKGTIQILIVISYN